MDVRGWLSSLSLGQYEERFRENKIDLDVLADLTDGDLQELGVPLGDRRQLLKAIAELPAHRPPAALRATQLDSAERRPITIMFCDLVGSTELAAALDVEDWRNLVNSYLDEASRAVTALDGRVLKRLGDGLMAGFGYPQAQENDAERAVRAALGVQQAVEEVNGRNAPTGAPRLPFASASKAARWSSTPRAKCSGKRPTSPPAFRPPPSLERCWSHRPFSGRSPDCSSSRTRAPMSSRALPRQ